jgi:hypothetical protein
VLEPALEQLGNRELPSSRRGAVLGLGQEAGEFGLGPAPATLEGAPALDWLALRVTAQVDQRLLGSLGYALSWCLCLPCPVRCPQLGAGQEVCRDRAPPRSQPQRTNEQVRDTRRGARAAESGSLLMS